MPRGAAQHPEKSRGPSLLQEFENSLPDFENLDEEQHFRFVKAIRLLCGYLDISVARLGRAHFSKFMYKITRLNELYEEYHSKDEILASAILFVNCTSSRTILIVKTRI